MEEWAVRVMFNGEPLDICNQGICGWEEWEALISQYFPTEENCPNFYKNFDGC
jgi:hypothetical protein